MCSTLSCFRRPAVALLNLGVISFLTCQAQAAPNTPEGFTLPLSKVPVQIAKEGKAVLPIVIAPGSTEGMKKTAAELAGFLKRMTGAEFAIEESKEARGITLGTIEQFPDEALKGPLALKENYNGIEAYSIRTDENRIRLVANTGLGVSHVAYRFLELMGCRWYFPTERWEIIPQNPNLSFQLNEDSRPDIWSRDIWFGRIGEQWEPGDPIPKEVYGTWKLRNRMAGSLQIKVAHAWHGVAKAFKGKYKKDFDEHPEYYALVDGKRPPEHQLCVTNPGLQKLMVDYAMTYFEMNPASDMMPFDPADGMGWCECDECKKLGHQSNQAFYLCNVVGKGIKDKYPTKFVGVLAYSWHSDPPAFNLEPNVYIQLTSGMNSSKKTFDELFEQWAAKCSHWGIYEYFSYWHADRSLWPGKATAGDLDALPIRMKRYVDNHVNSISEESSNNWGLYGLGYYIANKAMWNVGINSVALRKDFYEKAFGPAAAPMERYYERLNIANKPQRGAALILQNLADIEEATVLAKGRPDILARLTSLKECLVYNYIGFKYETTTGLPEEKDWMFSWLVWGHRTRTNFMNNWSGQRAPLGQDGMNKFGEDSWYIRKTKDNPWRDNRPVTQEELATWFEKVKTDFGKIITVEKIAYSNQYCLVDFGGGQGKEIEQKYSPEATLLLASMKGEPMKVKMWISKIEMETRDGKYTLVSSDGKLVTKGDLPAGDHTVEMKVPGPGIYRFTCRRGSGGWSIVIPGDIPNALLLSQEQPVRPLVNNKMYFYVPKGLKQIQFYTEARATPVVGRPDGSVAFEGVSNGNIITIPVGGNDGKVWSLSGKMPEMWAFNFPGVLSTNPDRVFVPEDVVKKDGLKVVLE